MRHRHTGFSLIELMVAVTLAMITGLVVLQVLANYQTRKLTTAGRNDAQVNAALGLPEMPAGDPANRGAGDISFVAFIDGLVGLGMAGEGSHAAGETADLNSLDVQAKRAALLMTRLSKAPR